MRAAHLRTAFVAAAVLSLAACAGSATTAPSPVTSPSAESPPATSTPAPTATPASTEAPDVATILDAARRDYGAPGALAVVVRDGERTFAASGTADTAGTPITESTRFRIASITKPIVAALVLDAVDRGELSLDDAVGDLLPGVLRPDPPVTVRQLLAHTSGIYDESNGIESQDQLQADIAALADPDLRAEAQAALEKALAGDPLRLQLTMIVPPDLGSPELRGYGTSTEDGSLVDVTDDLTWFGNGGNGGIISTPDELLTTMRAIVSGELIPAELVAEMRSPTSMSLGSYGLGLATYKLTCGTFYGHEGGVNGTASIAMVSPDGADGVVIALNLRSGEDPRLPALADSLLCGGT